MARRGRRTTSSRSKATSSSTFPTSPTRKAEKEDVHRRLRPFGLIDYLYRLRLRSNYEDSAMFIDGPEDEGPSEQVRSDLCLLAGSTSLVCEMYIMHIMRHKSRILILPSSHFNVMPESTFIYFKFSGIPSDTLSFNFPF